MISNDLARMLESFRPRMYSKHQFDKLSLSAKKAYLIQIAEFNKMCEKLLVPERKILGEYVE